MPAPLRLGVNVDHVATVRNARGGRHPDPIRAAQIAIGAGADGITAHLREDRRHIRDEDIARLMVEIDKPLNLEMGATAEMVEIAIKTRPHAVCLVPERRVELTTEGGLDVAAQAGWLKEKVAKLTAAGIRVSLFIAAELNQIIAAGQIAAPVIEIHVGAWCDALADGDGNRAGAEWERIRQGVRAARALGLEVHAGHGFTFETAEIISALPVVELNIGHFLVGEAV
jgi:pyridoxine 5-phosphate synthase